jgi:hypothetical protein
MQLIAFYEVIVYASLAKNDIKTATLLRESLWWYGGLAIGEPSIPNTSGKAAGEITRNRVAAYPPTREIVPPGLDVAHTMNFVVDSRKVGNWAKPCLQSWEEWETLPTGRG